MPTIVERVPVAKLGWNRQWIRCKKCRNVVYYDYFPGTLSNPIRMLPCGHGLGIRLDVAVDFISAEQAGKEPTDAT